MVPQLERVAHPLGAVVMSGGGFDSLTDKYNFAAQLDDRPTDVFDLGDHDPSGAHKCIAYQEDIEAFARELGGNVTFTRLAVTPDQIRQYGLPTAPAKDSDRRAFHGQTCQAEALAPDVLAGILHNALEARIDRRVLDRVMAQERRERKRLAALLRTKG